MRPPAPAGGRGRSCQPLRVPVRAWPMSAFEPGSRREASAHIRDDALGEAARIGRLSRVREFVLGAQDGLLVPLGVVTGMAAASPGRAVILVAGLAEAVAGSIAMGGGSYLASEAEEALVRRRDLRRAARGRGRSRARGRRACPHAGARGLSREPDIRTHPALTPRHARLCVGRHGGERPRVRDDLDRPAQNGDEGMSTSRNPPGS